MNKKGNYRYQVSYVYYNEYAHEDKEDTYSNNGDGYSIMEAIDIAIQLSQNGMRNVRVDEIKRKDEES